MPTLYRCSLLMVLVAGSAWAAPAAAGHPDEDDTIYQTARVIDVQPVVRIVRISEPQRECWDEHVRVESRPPRDTAGRALVGAVIGGAVGRQFGSGRGRDAATVAGAILGSAISTDHARRDDWYRSHGAPLRTRTRCDVRETWREEERVEGYRVTYEYDGQRYTTRTTRHPGDSLRVMVSVRPVGY